MQSERSLVPTLMVVTVVVGVTGSLGAPLVPELMAAHDVSLSTAQWSLTAPFVTGAVAAPVVGRLGSGRRRRPVLLALLLLATVGSLLAATATGIGGVIVGRALQGLAFAVQPLIFAVAREFLAPDALHRALGGLSVANAAAAGLGFPATAVVVQVWGVDAGFWLAVVLMLAIVLVAWVWVPGTDAAPARGIDVLGGVLMVLGLVSLLLLTSRGHDWGYLSVVSVGLAGASVLFLGLSAAWFLRAPAPLVDLRVAASSSVLGLHVATFLLAVGTYLVLGSVAVLVQAPESTGFGMGRTVVTAGFMLVPYAVGAFLGNVAAGKVARWLGPHSVLPIGCLLVAGGNGSLALMHTEVWQVVAAMTICGVGSGFGFQSIPWLMAQAVAAEELGSSTGLNVVVRFVGFGLGGAVSSAILEALGGPSGDGTAVPFQTVMLVGVGVGVVAAVVVPLLLRSDRREPAPSPA